MRPSYTAWPLFSSPCRQFSPRLALTSAAVKENDPSLRLHIQRDSPFQDTGKERLVHLASLPAFLQHPLLFLSLLPLTGSRCPCLAPCTSWSELAEICGFRLDGCYLGPDALGPGDHLLQILLCRTPAAAILQERLDEPSDLARLAGAPAASRASLLRLSGLAGLGGCSCIAGLCFGSLRCFGGGLVSGSSCHGSHCTRTKGRRAS